MSIRNLKPLLLILTTAFSTSVFAEDCGAPICSFNPDMKELSNTSKEAAKTQKDSVKEVFDEVSDSAFAAKDKMASSGCLNNAKGLNSDITLIDPRNIAKLNISQAVEDYIKNTACALATEAINKNVEKLNSGINLIGGILKEKSLGLVDLSSDTNNSGTFSAKAKVIQIQDSPLMKEFSDKANDRVNEEFFGDADRFNGDNNVDLTDPRYMDKNAPKGSEEVGTSIKASDLEDGALCFLNGC